jgi:uncharacterized protein (TIGR00156 family)
MNHWIKPILLIIMLAVFSNSNAQFIGIGSQTDSMSVSEIKKKALRLSWTDQWILVKGFIIEQINDDYFRFEDNTGRIKVEIERKYMPSIPFNSDNEVLISGEVCYPLFGRIYIGVKKIEFTGTKR